MRRTVSTEQGMTVVIDDTPFAKGGEGAVHKILSPNSLGGFCVKVYHPKQRDQKRQQKLAFMVSNPPTQLVGNNHRICWPSQLLFERGHFIGFLMPLAFSDSIELYELSVPKVRKKHGAHWQNVYDRTQKEGHIARLKLCTNLAITIHHIHRLKNYVLVDLKPQNVLVTIDGKVSITDCDSIQIAQNNCVLFPAKVATPEYTPSEGSQLNSTKQVIPHSWDLFSLGVIFYEVLLGIHPYTGSFSGKYKNMTALNEKIKHGLFVHGKQKRYVEVMPPLHNNFKKLSKELKQLFQQSLNSLKYKPNQRPGTDEWGKAFYNAVLQKKPHQKKLKTQKGTEQEGIGWWWLLYGGIPIIGLIVAICYSFDNKSKKSNQAHVSWIVGFILGLALEVIKG